jgi:hypothetical protein
MAKNNNDVYNKQSNLWDLTVILNYYVALGHFYIFKCLYRFSLMMALV